MKFLQYSLLFIMLAGCGQKGALYSPSAKPPPSKQPGATDQSAPKPPATQPAATAKANA